MNSIRPQKIVALVVATVALLALWRSGQPRAHGPLRHQAYVWQRSWNASVRSAVRRAEGQFCQLVILGAELTWEVSHPKIVRVPVDYGALRSARIPVGLGLRIGPYPGSFDGKAEFTSTVLNLAESLVTEAREAQLTLGELQIDFDCSDSKLDGYRFWIEMLRQKVSPLPVTITTLPSWLNQPAFQQLASASSGYVLQVHSLDPPLQAGKTFAMCDPDKARKAVERAGRLNVPFWVALPTYGYLMAFDSKEGFLGLSAEGPLVSWPEGTRLRVVRADATAMARLVETWTFDRPGNLQGLIWYRLPTDDDRLNWRWPTLQAVIAARTPHPELRAEARRPQPGLIEIDLVNQGEMDQTLEIVAGVYWKGPQLVAGDALNGFAWVEDGPAGVRLTGTSANQLDRILPGERRTIGWLRLDSNADVTVDVAPILP